MKKKFIFIILFTCASLFIVSNAYPVAYEASTLHNSVARSETVLDLFFERWERIQEMELYFDWYGKFNWVKGFKIYDVNAATQKKQAVDMTLVRTYGSITINVPILGGYEGKDMRERLKMGTGKYEGKKEEEGYWKPKNLILGFTATGFHYGLTRETTINRRPESQPAQEEEISDYKYTQFFDDIFAVSLLYRPYFFIHGGVIINNQIEPNEDGTMDYKNSKERTKRYFIASNLLAFLNLNATRSGEEFESLAVGVIINKLLKFAAEDISKRMPTVKVTFKSLNAFNDEPYDAVWVDQILISGTNEPKSSVLTDQEKEHAKLYTFSLGVKGDIKNYIYFDFFAELQKPSDSLIEKRTDKKIEYDKVRQINCMVGYNFLGDQVKDGIFFITSIGASKFWDIAIPVHRESGSDYYVYGFIFAMEGRFFLGDFIPLGFELKASKNYAPELRKLVETTDKYAFEFSLNTSF